jgi:hypothetical protein
MKAEIHRLVRLEPPHSESTTRLNPQGGKHEPPQCDDIPLNNNLPEASCASAVADGQNETAMSGSEANPRQHRPNGGNLRSRLQTGAVLVGLVLAVFCMCLVRGWLFQCGRPLTSPWLGLHNPVDRDSQNCRRVQFAE